MRKQTLWLVMLVLLALQVFATDLCDDTPTPDTLCIMITPTISCTTYNYSIYYTDNLTLIETGNLTLMNESIYYFNFTQEAGDYLVTLCDGTVREIIVGVTDNLWLAISLVLIAMATLFGVLAYMIKDKNLRHLKLMFFLLSVINIFVLGLLPLVIALNPDNPAAFIPVATGYFSINILCLVIFVWFYGVHMVKKDVFDRGDVR